jgi:hypothetical protein
MESSRCIALRRSGFVASLPSLFAVGENLGVSLVIRQLASCWTDQKG